MTGTPPRLPADLRAVIFDMDGVLVDSEPVNFQAMRRLLARYGLEYTEEDDRRFRGRRNLDLFATLRAAHPSLPREAELDGEYTALLTSLIRQSCRSLPGVPDVLHLLAARGYRLALASSSTPGVIAETLRSLGIDGVFALTVSGVEVPQGKPAPDIFLEAARRLHLPAAQCVVIEDSRNGVLAAVAAGMPCVGFPVRSPRTRISTRPPCASTRCRSCCRFCPLVPRARRNEVPSDDQSASANIAR